MIVGSIARRYARALFGLAVEQGKIEPWADALGALRQAVEGSAELRDVLVNPVYTREQRRAIVGKLAAALRLDAEPANLLYLLGDRNRLSHLGAIVDTFVRLGDAKLGRVRAHLTSAVPLDASAAQRISDKLSAATRAQVLLDADVDPELLGGVVAQVGSLTFDGSLRTQLEAMRAALKQ
jgi:F-type H+-transporting ATPase subunit delta